MRKMKNVVEVKNVVKSFKDKIVLNHVSFSMKPGEIVGFCWTKWCREKHINEMYV